MNNYLRLHVITALFWLILLLWFPGQCSCQAIEEQILALEALAVVVGGVDEDVGVDGEGLWARFVVGVITINTVHDHHNYNITDRQYQASSNSATPPGNENEY